MTHRWSCEVTWPHTSHPPPYGFGSKNRTPNLLTASALAQAHVCRRRPPLGLRRTPLRHEIYYERLTLGSLRYVKRDDWHGRLQQRDADDHLSTCPLVIRGSRLRVHDLPE